MPRKRIADGWVVLVHCLAFVSAIATIFVGRVLYDEWQEENSRSVIVMSRPSARLCQPQKPSRGSSHRDVVFLFGNSFCRGLEIAIKTLRHTGCQARVVFFTVPSFVNDKKAMGVMNSMNVEVFSECREENLVPHMIRYNYEYAWLVNHTGEVDRVLHADAYDIFFQADPFVDTIKKEYLTFIVEPHFIQSCGWNLNWFTTCFGHRETEKYKANFIICSGTICGGADHYTKLLKLMIHSPQWTSCYQPSFDQPILNWIVWSGQADEAGISYRFSGCDGGIMTVQWCVVNNEVRFNNYDQVLSPTNRVPALVHQYPRLEPLATHLNQYCRL